MAEDLTTQLLSLHQAGGQQAAQIAVMRKQHEMETALIDVVDEVTSKSSPPAPPGTGLVVDKQA